MSRVARRHLNASQRAMAFASPPWAGIMASAGISSAAAGSRTKRKACRSSLSFDDSERTYLT